MRLVLPAIIVVSFFSCQSSAVHSNRKHFAIKVDTNACRIEALPQDSADVIRIVQKRFNEIERLRSQWCVDKSLGIGTLKNGTDSLEIRLWGNDSTHALTDKLRLVVVKYTSGQFSAELFQFRYVTNPSDYSKLDSLIGYRVDLGKPKTGWGSLLKQLELLNLWTLPDYFDVPGYADEIDTDAGGYFVEVAKKKWYKAYGYANPAGKEAKYPEADKLMKIISLLKNEFDFNVE